jgi:integrase
VIPLDDVSWEWLRPAIPYPVSHGFLAQRWKKASNAAGYIGMRLNDLRHRLAQWLANAGVPEACIQQALRHSTPVMTRRRATQRDKGENVRTFAKVTFNSTHRPAVCPASVLDERKENVG